MAELLMRASGQDAALLRRIYGLDGHVAASARPTRVVVDAHVAASTRGGEVVAAARRAGVPLLIDPQTFYLQGLQHAADPWALLPYGRSAKLSPADIDPFVQEGMVAQVVNHQVWHGATAIIPPYVHLDRLDSQWVGVQAGLWRSTRRYMDRQAISLPVTAVVALGWRLLHPVKGPAALAPALAALSDLAPREIALASKADQGEHARARDRVTDLVMMVERLRRDYPVIAWQQGHLGELAVAAGATGYECGIGWREGCDLGAAANAHRTARAGRHAARPVFVPRLGRSIAKRSLEAIRPHRELWRALVCPDVECCPPGGATLLGDVRSHTIIQRAKSLDRIARIDRTVWRWQRLAGTADDGLDLAARINRLARTESAISQVNTRALAAVSAVAHIRRVDSRSRRPA